jgi:cellulose synthase operon protein YhjU
MGHWTLYFLLKLALYGAGLINLDVAFNLLFAATLAWPWTHRGWCRVWRIGAWPVALTLLYHDSFLPAPERLLGQWQAISHFSPAYLLELSARLWTPQLALALAVLVLGVLAWQQLRRRLRLSTWVWVGLVAAAMLPNPHPVPQRPNQAGVSAAVPSGTDSAAAPLDATQLEAALQTFYDTERGKVLRLPKDGSVPPFDLVVLSVCSLSWDDIAFAGLGQAPFLRRLDVVFDRFNSAATYSGPALLRLLRSTCGQTAQGDLYASAPQDCQLLVNLKQAGYEPALLLNHDGHFDRLAGELRRASGIALVPEQVLDAPVAMAAFDESPVRDDGESLTRWWRAHTAEPGGAPLALFYNSITLHDGNRLPAVGSVSSLQTYTPRAQKLFDELERFAALVEASGRPTVLVLVPEHGGAVRGDAQQMAGLRELPTRAITHVPAGVMMLGFGPRRPAGQPPVHVTAVSSHQSLMAVVAALMHGGAAAAAPARLAEVAQALPAIEWVAENDRTVVLQRGARSHLRNAEGLWITLDSGP